MPKIIKGDNVINDDWQIISKDYEGELPAGKLIIHIEKWLDIKNQTPGNNQQLAPWLDSDDAIEDFTEKLVNEPLIAVSFPTFMDGRGFSIARLLRERYSFSGELRAIGHIIQDQLCFLKRCGFDAYTLEAGVDLDAALASLTDFSIAYQTAADSSQPIFSRRTS